MGPYPVADTEALLDGQRQEPGNNVYGSVGQLFELKKRNRKMKILLSIGGWSLSENFPRMANCSTARDRFAKAAVEYMKDWGFDGLDIDWEYPNNAEDAENNILLLNRVREELDSYAKKHAPNYHFLLSIATSVSPEKYQWLKFKSLDSIDILNLMAYDFTGQWASCTKVGHSSNLFSSTKNSVASPFSADRAVREYIDRGFPANKILLGIPVFGHSFNVTSGLESPSTVQGNSPGYTLSNQTDPIGLPFPQQTGGQWDKTGTWDYKRLPKAGAKLLEDEEARAWYSYQKTATGAEVISFEVPQSVKAKVKYLKKQGLRGAFFWDASGDRTGEESLIGTSFSELGDIEHSDNLLSYPDSKYDNIRGAPARSSGPVPSVC
ncbi:hypothetical protein HIM_12593 [Hirsutella minnesotensis 3608]|uniref:chitinase n=1 Tax=Hirsutella minnesotensis 3608 TaxID=1043627 RepID=A0A0F7ZHU5_9HYPO|nr:hypothetical protein HIM_12593 [Hirsutella minnesotensis 3608]